MSVRSDAINAGLDGLEDVLHDTFTRGVEAAGLIRNRQWVGERVYEKFLFTYETDDCTGPRMLWERNDDGRMSLASDHSIVEFILELMMP